MKDFYFRKIDATEELKSKSKNISGIWILEGKVIKDKFGNIVNEEKYKIAEAKESPIKNEELKKITKKYTYEVNLNYENLEKDKKIIVLAPEDSIIFQDNISEILENEIIPTAFKNGKKNIDFERWGIRVYGDITFTKKEHKNIIKRFFNL